MTTTWCKQQKDRNNDEYKGGTNTKIGSTNSRNAKCNAKGSGGCCSAGCCSAGCVRGLDGEDQKCYFLELAKGNGYSDIAEESMAEVAVTMNYSYYWQLKRQLSHTLPFNDKSFVDWKKSVSILVNSTTSLHKLVIYHNIQYCIFHCLPLKWTWYNNIIVCTDSMIMNYHLAQSMTNSFRGGDKWSPMDA